MNIVVTVNLDVDLVTIGRLVDKLRSSPNVKVEVYEAPRWADLPYPLPHVVVSDGVYPQRHFGEEALATLRSIAAAA